MAVAAGDTPDKTTLTVEGPTEQTGQRRVSQAINSWVQSAPIDAGRTFFPGRLCPQRTALNRTHRAIRAGSHLDPMTTREIDALVEGLVLHTAVSTDPKKPIRD